MNEKTYAEQYIDYLNALVHEGELFQDISISVHDEIKYNKTNDVEIIVKFLPGQYTGGIPQFPLELLVECTESLAKEVKDKFINLFAAINETIITLDGGNFKQLYGTPTVMATFVNSDNERTTTMEISASLFVFSNVLGVSTIDMSINGVNFDALAFLSIGAAYENDTNSTGGINKPETLSVGGVCARSYTISWLPKDDETNAAIIQQLFTGTDTNKGYHIKLDFFGNNEIDVPTKECIIKSGTYSQDRNGFPIASAIFVVKG